MSSMSLDELRRHMSPVWTRIFDLVVDHGEGVYLFDINGRRYLDFTSGIGVTNTGHAHPRVVKAVQEQAARLLHGQANIVIHEPMLRLIEQLLPVMPESLNSFFFTNSGAEAVEGAIKLARYVTKRPNIIVFQGSFHGRTNATMAATTSKTAFRAGYQPLASGMFVAPFPYTYRYGWDERTTLDFCLKELKLLLKTQTAPDETAAMLIEPVQGEGGYVVPPPGFISALREICDHYGMMLIVDEIQSGFGRTGKWFAFEHYGVVPDVIIMAKGLASGLPLAGLAARPEAMAKWATGSHGGTYGGNVVACAAGVASIKVLREEKLIENSAAMGQVLISGLRKLQEEYPEIGDVRGLGLMVGAEFTSPQGEPWTDRAKAILKTAMNNGLLLLTCGPWDNTVRWIPPLIVNEAQIKEAMSIFEKALQATK
jgi:4-aminobutyrate aminotransferase